MARTFWAGRMARRAAMGGVAATMALGALISMAPPAGAVLTNGCTGQGTFAKGTTPSGKGPFAAESIPAGQVITVPLEDTVTWSGSVPVPQSNRNINGFVAVKLPWPFGSFDIDTWSGPSDLVKNNGVKHYKLPSFVPRGTVFQVYGAHHDTNGVDCAGFVLIKVEGSSWSSFLTPISVALTVGFGLLLLALGRARLGF